MMFGSEQVMWSEFMGDLVNAIDSAEHLTAGQKRAIFYENAARFLGLEGGQPGDS